MFGYRIGETGSAELLFGAFFVRKGGSDSPPPFSFQDQAASSAPSVGPSVPDRPVSAQNPSVRFVGLVFSQFEEFLCF